MDTRTKIIDLEEARRIVRRGGLRTALVTGHFDPLLAGHAERLEQIRRSHDALVVVVLHPVSPILESGARAALVAGLEAVDYVATCDAGELPESDWTAAAIREEHADQRRLVALIQHVHARQLAGVR
ncbi:MAG: hypothetical protein ABI165_04750 [Bryobacteraceae bacterium]